MLEALRFASAARVIHFGFGGWTPGCGSDRVGATPEPYPGFDSTPSAYRRAMAPEPRSYTFFPWTARNGALNPDISPFQNIIIHQFPELAGASFRPLTMGWHSIAIDVDDRLIFKFPRNAEAERALRREAGILAAVRPRISMRVPALELFNAPRLFSCHAKIPGEHLLADQYEQLPPRARERLADELALFYAQLHALSAELMIEAGAAAILPWQSVDAIRRKALPILPAEHRPICERTIRDFESMASDPLGTTYGFFDGHGWNMAFDPVEQRINGVYDFADSGLGPLHQDFVYASFISLELMYATAERYAGITGRSVDFDRIGVLAGMHRLSELAELAVDPRHVEVKRESVLSWIGSLGGAG